MKYYWKLFFLNNNSVFQVSMMKQAIIIGRFQVPVLHAAYRDLIEFVKRRSDRGTTITLVLGESPLPGSKNNPLSVEARIGMIHEVLPDVVILSLKDHPLDEVWSDNLDVLIQQKFPDSEIILYGDQQSFNRYSGRYPAIALPETSPENTHPVEKPFSRDFRDGVVYAFSSSYAKVFPTVDVAFFRKNKQEILLGKKPLDKKWRLIGGFADPGDENFEEAAKRELKEECGDIKCSNMVYERSFKIDDWRYRYEEDKIISILFSTDYESGEPLASDDIAEIKWVPVSSLNDLMESNATAPEHKPLFTHLLNRYWKQE